MVSEIVVKAQWLTQFESIVTGLRVDRPAMIGDGKKLTSEVTLLGKLSSLKWHRQSLCTIQLSLRVYQYLRFLASAKDHTGGYVLDRYGRCRTRVAEERWWERL